MPEEVKGKVAEIARNEFALSSKLKLDKFVANEEVEWINQRFTPVPVKPILKR